MSDALMQRIHAIAQNAVRETTAATTIAELRATVTRLKASNAGLAQANATLRDMLCDACER